ncbi:MAG: YfhO family protein [Lachnospiraceae bacterium]|nr:YfhO family protein [Lachnospiraceae bacterium]
MLKDKISIKSFLERHSFYIAAFLLPFLVMLSIFVLRQIYPFGDRSFLHIDMYHQYFPFLTEFYHKLKSGDSLLFSWNTGLGSNFLALYTYYLASPFNWLCIFVPEKFLIEFQSYLVIFKIGLCGFTCSYYFSHHFHKKHPGLLLFSTFYALSGFLAAYNWNVMWLDVIFLTPLVVLGLESLVDKRNFKLYTICLTICILSNFYISIMLCIYLALYFLLVLLPDSEKKLVSCRDFALFSLLSAGMAALLLLPELSALSLSEFSGSSFPKDANSYFALLDVFARHNMDVAVEIGLDHWPNVYAGVSVFILIPLYIICKSIPTVKKMGKLILLSFFLISFSSNALTFLWHGFNYPNSLPSRQSYLYILLLLTVCAECFFRLKEFSKEELSRVFFGVMVFLVLCQKLITDDAFTNRTYLLSACFLLAYGYLLHLYRNRPGNTSLLVFSFLLLFTLEAGLNTFLTSCPTVSRTNYLKNYREYTDMADVAQKSGSFRRFERLNRVTSNDGMLYDYPSASLFSSTMNGLITSFYEEFGMKSSKVYYSFDGATPFTAALLNVTGQFKDSGSLSNYFSHLNNENTSFGFYTSKQTLPFGYGVSVTDPAFTSGVVGKNQTAEKEEMIKKEEDEPSLYDLTELFVDSDYAQEVVLDDDLSQIRFKNIPLENQNQLAKKLGADSFLFLPQNVENGDSHSLISIPADGYYYAYSLNDKAVSCSATITSSKETSSLEFKKMKDRSILDLGYLRKGDTVILKENSGKALDLALYRLQEDVFLSLIEKLNQQALTLHTFTSTQIEGSITLEEDGYLILSMAYDPGWTLLVDGKETQPQMLEGLFISTPLSKGEHLIQLSFFPKGLKAGITVSLCSFTLFLLLVWRNRKKFFLYRLYESNDNQHR